VDGADIRVLIGTAFGQTSPVQTYSQTLYLDVAIKAGGELALDGLPAEAAIYPISGALEVDGAALELHNMALLDTATRAASSRQRRALRGHWRRAAGRPSLYVLELRLVAQGARGAGGRGLGGAALPASAG
jgi:hypothetical protein